MNVSIDVLRLLVPRMSMWDARSLQMAYVQFAEIVHDHVSCVVDRALAAPRPAAIDAFLKTPPGFVQRVQADFVMMRTPRDLTIQFSRGGGVTVVLYLKDGRACVELRVLAGHGRPSFDTLESTLAAVWWFAQALKECGDNNKVYFDTRARTHCPMTEVLNATVAQFIQRRVVPTWS